MKSSVLPQCRSLIQFGLRNAFTLAAAVVFLSAARPAVAQGPGSSAPFDANIVGEFIRATAIQPDGKVIIAGSFSSVLGTPRSNIARLNADGTLDLSFSVKTNDWVYSVAIQPDGKILLAGLFTKINPTSSAPFVTRNYIARVNADGSVDAGFDPNADNHVSSVILQPDGKILIGGYFTSLTPAPLGVRFPTTYIARLEANGSIDPMFNIIANDFVYCLALQPDGKILIGGQFNTAGGAQNFLGRLNADATVDTAFSPTPNNWVYSIAVQPDGKIIIGGAFTSLRPTTAAATPRNYLARLTPTGGLDTGFNPGPGGYVQCLALQSDGRILVGGEFTFFKPNGSSTATNRKYAARLNISGTVDPGFNPAPNARVFSLGIQTDGKVLLGGEFGSLQAGGTRNRFALLNNDEAINKLTAPDPSRVLWMRGGSSHEIEGVAFQLSTDGGLTFSDLGMGTRIGTTADWELLNPSLPPNGQLRAVARNGSGSRGSGFLETRSNFGDAPDIAVEEPAGTTLEHGTASISFGSLPLASTSPARTVTVRNSGIANLINLTVSLAGPNTDSFAVSAPGSSVLTPGSSTTFSVTCSPMAVGLQTSTIRITSNVTGPKNPFLISLTGEGSAGLAAWNETWFDNPEGTGDAAPDADPNFNSIPNIFEYALGGDPVGHSTGTAILPVPSVNPVTMRRELTFKRQISSTGITLTIQASNDPSAGWEDCAISANATPFTTLTPGYAVNETGTGAARTVTLLDIPTASAAPRFMRLKVTQP